MSCFNTVFGLEDGGKFCILASETAHLCLKIKNAHHIRNDNFTFLSTEYSQTSFEIRTGYKERALIRSISFIKEASCICAISDAELNKYGFSIAQADHLSNIQ